MCAYCAGGSDYIEVLEVLSFNGETMSHEVLVNVMADQLVEREEFFTLKVELVNTSVSVGILHDEATITIVDHDSK